MTVATRAPAVERPRSGASGWLAVVTSGFPRRSETFLLNELLALDAAGALAGVFATKPGDEDVPQPGAERLAGHVRVLAPGTEAEQGRELARRLAGTGVAGVHGYFAHTPAAVAAVAARALGVPYGFSAHARDARKVSAAELRARASAARCVIACNADVAAQVARSGARPVLVPHGVDLQRFRPIPPPAFSALRLLAVGRLVEKKGFDVLVEAMRGLDGAASLRIVGEGPQRARLEAAIATAGLGRRVELAGALNHDRLPAEYRAADVVVVPSLADGSGDRDGLPNVVLEAIASGRPVVAGDVGAISSAVVDGVTGLLVPPADPDRLREALAALARSPGLRRRLGAAGRSIAEARFELGGCTRRLADVLGRAYA